MRKHSLTRGCFRQSELSALGLVQGEVRGAMAYNVVSDMQDPHRQV